MTDQSGLSDIAQQVLAHLRSDDDNATIMLQSCCTAHGGVSFTSTQHNGGRVYVLTNKLGQKLHTTDQLTLARAFIAACEGTHIFLLVDGVRFCKLDISVLTASVVQAVVDMKLVKCGEDV